MVDYKRVRLICLYFHDIVLIDDICSDVTECEIIDAVTAVVMQIPRYSPVPGIYVIEAEDVLNEQ